MIFFFLFFFLPKISIGFGNSETSPNSLTTSNNDARLHVIGKLRFLKVYSVTKGALTLSRLKPVHYVHVHNLLDVTCKLQ